MTWTQRIVLWLILMLAAPEWAFGQADLKTQFLGRKVSAVIDEFRADGLPFAYSTNLVSDSMLVAVEPTSREPIEIVREILKPHRLAVREQDEFFLIVRMTKAEVQAPPVGLDTSEGPVIPVLATVTVSASRYHLSRDLGNSIFYIDQRTIQTMPDLGEDPLRIAQRLPGTAAGGFSAMTHFRGGEQNETGIILNGNRLFDPFHIRDYQAIFSSVDSRAINGVEIYTGGFPVRYGDRMSGLVLIDTLNPDQPRRTELGLSVFNSSFLSAGTIADGEAQWLVSGRRGNLDLILDKKFGESSYYDLFGQISLNFSPDTQLSVNALYARDDVVVVLESELDELEQSTSATRNAQLWLRLDNQWTQRLSSTSLLSFGSFRNDRVAFTRDEEKYVSLVDDRRSIDQFGLRQDWTFGVSREHRLQWGFQIEHSEADYRYESEVSYFGLSALLAGSALTRNNDIQASPDGASYAFYLADRWRVFAGSFLELGLRWDEQTYTSLSPESQLSPRISLFHALTPDTELRLSWGRYHQSQGIHELQVEDGVSTFSRAQRSDHIIAGLYHRFGKDNSLRIEAFQKNMSRLRPRFENLYDPLALIPEIAPDRIRIEPTKAQARGIEFSFDHTGNGSLNWWASYTLSKVSDTVNGIEQPRSWDQRHSFLAGVSMDTKKWDLGFVINVHSGWPKTGLALIEGVDGSGEVEFTAVRGPRNDGTYKTFASLDARIGRKIDVRRGKLSVFFELINATNRHNVCCSDYDLEENADGNIALELSDDFWLPLFPAIGILWEF